MGPSSQEMQIYESEVVEEEYDKKQEPPKKYADGIFTSTLIQDLKGKRKKNEYMQHKLGMILQLDNEARSKYKPIANNFTDSDESCHKLYDETELAHIHQKKTNE